VRGFEAPHPHYKGFKIKCQGGKYEIFIVCGDLRAGVRAGAVGYSEDFEMNRPQAGRRQSETGTLPDGTIVRFCVA